MGHILYNIILQAYKGGIPMKRYRRRALCLLLAAALLLPVAPPPATTVDRVIEAVPEVVDKVTEFWEKQQEKKGQPDPDVVE